MDCGILREVYDDNLKRIIRLRMLQDNSVVFTTIKNNSEEVSATCLQRPILAQIRVTKNCNLNCPYCYANDSSSYHFMKCGNVFVDDWMELWSSEPMELLRGIDECTDCQYNCKVWCRAMKYAVDSNFYGKSHFCLKGIT